jgi:hypothetical protein
MKLKEKKGKRTRSLTTVSLCRRRGRRWTRAAVIVAESRRPKKGIGDFVSDWRGSGSIPRMRMERTVRRFSWYCRLGAGWTVAAAPWRGRCDQLTEKR